MTNTAKTARTARERARSALLRSCRFGRAGAALGAALTAIAAFAGSVGFVAPATGAPAPGSWSDAATPTKPVYKSGLLSDGRVLAAEYDYETPTCVSRTAPKECYSFELYNPSENRWTSAGTPDLPNPARIITGLQDGTALVGFGSTITPYADIFHYYPNTNTWTPIRSEYLRAAYYTHTLIVGTPDQCGENCGKVLVAGGSNDSKTHNANDGLLASSAELFDPKNNTLTLTGLIPPPGHTLGAAAALLDGRVLATAGSVARESYFFDPKTGEWSRAADMSVGDAGGAAVRLLDGRLLVGMTFGTTELFDPAAGDVDPLTGRRVGSWTAVDPCPAEDNDCDNPTLLPDGTVLALGRREPNKVFVFDPASIADPGTPDWTEVAPPAIEPPTGGVRGALVRLVGTTAQCGANCDKVLGAGKAAQLYSISDRLEVTALSPRSGFSCGGAEVTISGRGLNTATEIRFGGNTVDFDKNPDGSAITVTAPPHLPGSVGVSVLAQGRVISGPSFEYKAVPDPAIKSKLSPELGPVSGGTKVDLAGSFAPECVRAVHFGDKKAASYAVGPAVPGVAATTIAATSPAHDPARVRVRVEVDFGPKPPSGPLPTLPSAPTLPSLPTDPAPSELDVFTFHPVISGLFPPSGPLAGGNEVTIAGAGLANASEVRFGTQTASISRRSENQVVAVAPPSALPGPVAVRVAAGEIFAPDNVVYSYVDPPVVVPDADTGDPGTGTPKETAGPEPAPPGGSPALSPVNAPAPASAPGPAPSPSPVQAPSAASGPAQSPVPAKLPGLAPGSAPSQAPASSVSAGQAPGLPPVAPAPGPAAAPASAAPGSASANQPGAAGDDRGEPAKGSTRHAMVEAQLTMGMAAAGTVGCFSFLALSRRRRRPETLRASRAY